MATISEDRIIGNVNMKIGVDVEPSDNFRDVARALGFVRVIPCFDCEFQGTPKCPMKEGTKYMAFCSLGKRVGNNGD